MPLLIFSPARLGRNPSITAVATMIIEMVDVCVTVGSVLIARAERRRAAEINAG